jgi:hypothetical protein
MIIYPSPPTCNPATPIAEIEYATANFQPSIQLSNKRQTEKTMKFFNNMNKKSNAATLVKHGLANEDTASVKQILDCIYLLANGLGETWKTASKEAAAGMVLLTLAKNIDLANYLNNNGWKLVLSFISTNPKIARDISARTMGQIFAYQATAHEPMLMGI